MYPLVKFAILFSILSRGLSLEENIEEKYADDTLAQSHGGIIFSSVIFRHGERTIKLRYPTDPYPESIWNGLLQLTKRGKQEVYDLGKWYRKRYQKLMGDGYDHETLLVNSTYEDRALMSAELFLAGMFPPTEKEMWSDDGLKWQPIPIHTCPSKLDHVLGLGARCPRIDFELDYWTSAADAQAFYETFKDTFNYTCEHAGYSAEKCSNKDVFKSSQLVWNVYNALYIEESNNMTLPDWTKAIYPEPSRTISVYYFMAKTYSLEVKRLKGGPLLQNIIGDMKLKRDGKNKKKLHVYSAQESTIAIFLNSLNVFNNMIPDYTASVITELREKSHEYYVTMFYRNSTDEPPHLLQIPNCSIYCTLDDFINVTEYLMVNNWEEECQLQSNEIGSSVLGFNSIGLIAIIVACSALVIGTFVIFCKNFQIIRKKSYKMYYETL